jgi:hypothetical protein
LEGASYGDALDSHKFHGFCRIAAFEAKFNDLSDALHQSIQILRLGVAPTQLWHVGNVIAILIALDYNREFPFCSHYEPPLAKV